MKSSETRILTTHTGSLPLPEGLVAMLGAVEFAREQASL